MRDTRPGRCHHVGDELADVDRRVFQTRLPGSDAGNFEQLIGETRQFL